MRIGLLAPPWVPVPPTGYGGTEAVVDILARGLAAGGHDVLLFTTGDATCPVPRASVFAEAPAEMNASMPELRHVQAGYEALADCDLVHDHTTVGPVWAAATGLAGAGGVPVVVTVHNAFDAISVPVYRRIARTASIVAISGSHRRAAEGVEVAATIHHGVDASIFPVGDGTGGYAAFVGRMSADKGVAEAIRIARAAEVPLRIAAKMRTNDERAYYEEHVRPEEAHDVEYVGEIAPHERDELMGAAVALLNPISWAEPFGMVMVESLACGTPVIAYRSGAAPEIVRDGETGFLCRGWQDAAERLHEVGRLDRAACRAEVEGYFSAQRMVAEYEALYARVLAAPDRPGPP